MNIPPHLLSRSVKLLPSGLSKATPYGNGTLCLYLPHLLHMIIITMKATMTQDLLTGMCRINIKTCSEAINYMGEIYGFIRDTGLFCRMTTDFYRVSFSIRGHEEINKYVPKIMQFISDVQNGRVKQN